MDSLLGLRDCELPLTVCFDCRSAPCERVQSAKELTLLLRTPAVIRREVSISTSIFTRLFLVTSLVGYPSQRRLKRFRFRCEGVGRTWTLDNMYHHRFRSCSIFSHRFTLLHIGSPCL